MTQEIIRMRMSLKENSFLPSNWVTLISPTTKSLSLKLEKADGQNIIMPLAQVMKWATAFMSAVNYWATTGIPGAIKMNCRSGPLLDMKVNIFG